MRRRPGDPAVNAVRMAVGTLTVVPMRAPVGRPRDGGPRDGARTAGRAAARGPGGRPCCGLRTGAASPPCWRRPSPWGSWRCSPGRCTSTAWPTPPTASAPAGRRRRRARGDAAQRHRAVRRGHAGARAAGAGRRAGSAGRPRATARSVRGRPWWSAGWRCRSPASGASRPPGPTASASAVAGSVPPPMALVAVLLAGAALVGLAAGGPGRPRSVPALAVLGLLAGLAVGRASGAPARRGHRRRARRLRRGDVRRRPGCRLPGLTPTRRLLTPRTPRPGDFSRSERTPTA